MKLVKFFHKNAAKISIFCFLHNFFNIFFFKTKTQRVVETIKKPPNRELNVLS